MGVYYQYIAGHSLGRLAALSDGIFAVAMTILVLDLHVPVLAEVNRAPQALWQSGTVESERLLWQALVHLAPSLLAYVVSFLTLGMFWVGHQTQLDLSSAAIVT